MSLLRKKSISKIDAVILCGGLGKRLRPVTGSLPKVLALIGKKPFLDILLSYLACRGIRRAILCTGYKAQEIERYYRDHPAPLAIEFSREKTPLGTGGAIKNAEKFVKSSTFFALNGDCFCRLDFEKLLAFHKQKKSQATLVVSDVKDKSDFGAITLDRSGKIVSFQEKMKGSKTRYVSAGIYCFKRKIFSKMPSKKVFSIEKDFFPRLADKKMYGFIAKNPFIDIGTPRRYRQANKSLP